MGNYGTGYRFYRACASYLFADSTLLANIIYNTIIFNININNIIVDYLIFWRNSTYINFYRLPVYSLTVEMDQYIENGNGRRRC